MRQVSLVIILTFGLINCSLFLFLDRLVVNYIFALGLDFDPDLLLFSELSNFIFLEQNKVESTLASKNYLLASVPPSSKGVNIFLRES